MISFLSRDPALPDVSHDFAARWTAWHRAQDAPVTAPHGLLCITALHWITEHPRRYPGVPGAWETGAAGVSVTLLPGEELTLDDVPLTGTHEFGPIGEGGAVLAGYRDTVLEIARRGGLYLLRPRRPDTPQRTRFRGTPAFPAHRRWVLPGRFVAYPRPVPTLVADAAAGLQHQLHAVGHVRFELDDTPMALTAFAGAGQRLRLPFTDATSGRATWSAGRVLDVPGPDAAGNVVLDLNRAANLPGAYTGFATCPLPPAENRLPVAIEAGHRVPDERAG